MLDLHSLEFGYVEIFPPFLVNSKSPKTTGNLPKFSQDMNQIENDNLQDSKSEDKIEESDKER